MSADLVKIFKSLADPARLQMVGLLVQGERCGQELAAGTIKPGYYMAMDGGGASGQLSGDETTDPAFGLPAWWIRDAQRDEAEILGVDDSTARRDWRFARAHLLAQLSLPEDSLNG